MSSSPISSKKLVDECSIIHCIFILSQINLCLNHRNIAAVSGTGGLCTPMNPSDRLTYVFNNCHFAVVTATETFTAVGTHLSTS